MNLSNIDLLALAETDTTFRRTAITEGGNYAGKCPVCGDKDDFYVLPEHTGNDGKQRGQCACRECHPQRMDAIGYLQWARKISYREAVEYLHEMYSLELPENWDKGSRTSHTKKPEPAAPVYRIKPLPMNATPPSAIWQTRAKQAIERAQQHLMHEEIGRDAREYLHSRGLTDETIRAESLGFVPKDTYDDPLKWGLNPDDVEKVYIPRGILFPYIYKGEVWKIRIRRFGDNIPKEKRYMMVSGSANGLYRADELKVNRPALLFEGEIDALSVAQEIGDLAVCVATGSTAHARIDRWKMRLALASQVLLCFDGDPAGQEAITYWGKRLGEIAAHLPIVDDYKDANDLLIANVDIRSWVAAKIVVPNGTNETKSSPSVLATSEKPPIAPIHEEDAITEAVAFLDVLQAQSCYVRYYENGQCGITVPESWNDAQFESIAQAVAHRDAVLRRLIPCSPGKPTQSLPRDGEEVAA